MPDFAADPNAVHEVLVIALFIGLFVGVMVAMAYVRVLGWFFEELKSKEPEVWATIGSPTVLDMLALPFARFRKYWAFVPVLRERAATGRHAYRYAAAAYRLLLAGLSISVILFGLSGVTAFWIAYHGL